MFLMWTAHFMAGIPVGNYHLILGKTHDLSPDLLYFSANLAMWGGLGAVFGAIGIAMLAPTTLGSQVPVASKTTALYAGIIAFLFAAALRWFLFQNMPVADDESDYQFMAETLLTGHVTTPSPHNPWFVDRVFMINDGRFYAQYFLGWPALMSVGALFGAPGYVNAVLFGLTMPALWIVLRSLVGPRWTTIGLGLAIVTPLMFFNAATQLSHTSAICLLGWGHALHVLAKKHGAKAWPHALLAVALAGAFFNRPLSAIGLGVPIGLAWFWQTCRSPKPLRALAAFAVPAGILGALFLTVNTVQNGGPLRSSYQQYILFLQKNDYRFGHLPAGWKVKYSNIRLFEWPTMMKTFRDAIQRLNLDLFGWPSSFLFLPAALPIKAARLPLAMLAFYLLCSSQITEPGIDSFGPVHFSEIAWPMVILTVIGIRALSVWLARFRFKTPWARNVPLALALLLCTSCLSLYMPVRGGGVRDISNDQRVPHEVVKHAGLHNAVIFASYPVTPRCLPAGLEQPPFSYAFWRPNNDPAMKNDILWVNHLSTARDREYVRSMPGRKGYWLGYNVEKCASFLIPIDSPNADKIPNGWVSFAIRPTGLARIVFSDAPPDANGKLVKLPHPSGL